MKYKKIKKYKYLVHESIETEIPESIYKHFEESTWKLINAENYTFHLRGERFFVSKVRFPNSENVEYWLTIKKGYAWDGATGVPDVKSIIKPSCIHDCFFQMMREGLLYPSAFKEINKKMRNDCLDSGMNSFFAWTVEKGINALGKKYIKSEVLECP